MIKNNNKTKKKSLQAKRKIVKSKTKAAKKKSSKKAKVVKKSSKKTGRTKRKAAKKKATKRTVRKKISMEDLYPIINKVQMGGKKVVFAVSLSDCPVVENTLRDAMIEYDKVEMKTQSVYTLHPKERELIEDAILENLEVFEDENPDIDLLFP